MLLEAALNGTRTRSEHPAIPVTPDQLARDAAAAVLCGAEAVHVHVRGRDEHESLDPDDVARTVEAIRSACPNIPIGISTGAWIVPDLRDRLRLIRSWTSTPDFASVNLHEMGAVAVIRSLLDKGIGIEAGIWNAPAARTLVESDVADECLRLLIEPAEGSGNARENLRQIEAVLKTASCPRLLHGLGLFAWEFVRVAAERGYDTRTGLEDTLSLPDGTRAAGNEALVAVASRMLGIETKGRGCLFRRWC